MDKEPFTAQQVRDAQPPIPIGEILLLSRVTLGLLLGMSPETIDDLTRRGVLPAPIIVGGSRKLKRWPRPMIDDWLLAGCPVATGWKWTPIRVESLARREQSLVRDVEDATRELDRIRSAQKQGMTHCEVRASGGVV